MGKIYTSEEISINILSFKDSKGKQIDFDYVEGIVENNKLKFFEMSCCMKVQEVYPEYVIDIRTTTE